MTAIRKREINLYGRRMRTSSETGPSSYLALRRAIYSCRVALFANLFPLLASLHSLLEPERTNERTKEGSLAFLPQRRPRCRYANQIKVALESIYAATSAATLKNRPASREESCGCARVTITSGALWMVRIFFFRVSITGFLVFLFLFLEFQSISLSTIWIVQSRKRRVWEGGLESSSSVINWNRRDLKAWWLITKFFFLVYSSF